MHKCIISHGKLQSGSNDTFFENRSNGRRRIYPILADKSVQTKSTGPEFGAIKVHAERGWEIAATRDVRLIIIYSNNRNVHIRNTQLHWRPIVVRLGPRVWVQCTRSGQRAYTVQLSWYGMFRVYYMCVYMCIWMCVFMYCIREKIQRYTHRRDNPPTPDFVNVSWRRIAFDRGIIGDNIILARCTMIW